MTHFVKMWLFTDPVIQVVPTNESVKKVGMYGAKETITLLRNLEYSVNNYHELKPVSAYLFYTDGSYLSISVITSPPNGT